jgi:hypothetical protein
MDLCLKHRRVVDPVDFIERLCVGGKFSERAELFDQLSPCAW